MKLCTTNLGLLLYDAMDYPTTVAYHNRTSILMNVAPDYSLTILVAEEIELGIHRMLRGAEL